MKKQKILPYQISISLVFIVSLMSIGTLWAADLTGMIEPAHRNSVVAVTPQAYGIAGDSISTVGATLFRPAYSSSAVDFDGFGFASTNPGSDLTYANPVLATGVLVNALEFEACDTSNTTGIELNFYGCEKAPTGFCYPFGYIYTGEAETPGCNVFTMDLSASPVVIDNAAYLYYYVIREYDNDFSTSYRGVRTYWRRQVSPDPAYATFSDVPFGHWAHQYVEALYASGITEGYSDGTFRPGQPVLRGQMAAFLSKALGLHWPY